MDLFNPKTLFLFIIFLFLLNSSFILISYLYPNITPDKTLVYQLWLNSLVIFFLILPSNRDYFLR